MNHKSHYDPAKERWREAWYQFIRGNRHFLDGKPKDWKVVFFPGEEALEVEVYDRLKIPRENLLGLEMDEGVHERLRKKKLGIRLTDEPVDALDFFQQTEERFDIGNLDYEGTLNPNVVRTLSFIAGRQLLREDSIFGLTVLGKREPKSTQEVYYGAVISEDILDSVREILGGGIPKSPEEVLESHQNTSRKEKRSSSITIILTSLFHKGLSNLGICPVYMRNPDFSSIVSAVSKLMPDLDQAVLAEFSRILHFKSLVDHFKETGVGSQDDSINLARVVIMHQNKTYFPQHMARMGYTSYNGAPMLSDFVHFAQCRNILERYGYLATNAYVDLNFYDFMLSVFGGRPSSKAQVDRIADRMRKDFDFLLKDLQQEITNPKSRIFLGSSAKLPRLAGEEYYRRRYEDEERGIPLQETWAGLMREYKVRRSQLPRFEAHYTMGTHGPKHEHKPASLREENLETKIETDRFEIIPAQYWNRLTEPYKRRIAYFLEEDLLKVNLTRDKVRGLVGEIMASRWYKQLEEDNLSNPQFYAFFDDILLELASGRIPDRRNIRELFDNAKSPEWKERYPVKVKPVLTLELYEQLSFYEGIDDQSILADYQTPKPNSIRAYKAWVTMRHNKIQIDRSLGPQMVSMLKEGRTKSDIMQELNLKEFQYRGFLAAHKRGAYRHQEQKNPLSHRVYVDSHGVVHVNPRNIGDTEGGYR